MKCPECGNEVADNVKVCPSCGYEIIPSETDVQENTKNSVIFVSQSKNFLIYYLLINR